MPHMPGKVLIVEDSPTMRQLYRIVLGSGGVQLLFAENGVEGLNQAAQERDIELFIVDVNMPQMDGLEFLKRLRGELRMNQPAIVASTECAAEDKEAARVAGATAYLCKPWTPEQLRTLVVQVFEETSE